MVNLTLAPFYALAGLLMGAVAVTIAADSSHPRRLGSAIFWMLLAICVGAGRLLPPIVVGYMVLAMTVLVAASLVAAPNFAMPSPAAIAADVARLGNRLIWPVLLVPAIAIAATFGLPRLRGTWLNIGDATQVSLVGIGLGCVVALLIALRVTRTPPTIMVKEGGRLLQSLGWTLVLPPMLAALGGIFAKAGVGDEIARYVAMILPVQHAIVAVIAYCSAMTLFTMLVGNAFAAFPVITLGVGLPFIVKQHGGDPAIMGALGMLSGYCGTLLTPMAANFNLVPVKLLELADDNAVIKAQAPFAAGIWIFNTALMAVCVYRF